MALKYGVGMGRTDPITDIAANAKLAEDLGYDHVTFIDSQNLSRDSVAMMTVAAMSTDRIRIGQGVTQPFTRHMAVCANAVATIDELSGGRAFLGIGAGMSSTGVLKKGPGTHASLAAAIEFFRRFTSGEEAEWDGVEMHSEWAGRRIPVIMGAGGPKAMRLAATIADGCFMPGVDPSLVKWRLQRLEDGGRAAGSPSDNFEPWVRTMVYVDENLKRARDEVRPYAATCAYGIWLATLRHESSDAQELRAKLPEHLIEEMTRIGLAYDMYEHEKRGARHAADASDELIDAMVIAGPPAKCIEQIEALREVGIDRLSMVLYSLSDPRGAMQRFSETVLPKLS